MPRVLVCSDEPNLSASFIELLSEFLELRSCGWCRNVDALAQNVDRLRPDVLLLDLNTQDEAAVLARIQSIALKVKTVLWVRSISASFAMQAMSLGVRGLVTKETQPETLVRCLLCVEAGELWFEKSLTNGILEAQRDPLTAREHHVILLLSQGLRNREIALEMGIPESGVKTSLTRLFRKLNVKDRLDLVLYGLKDLRSPAAASPKRATGGTFTAQNPGSPSEERAPAWR